MQPTYDDLRKQLCEARTIIMQAIPNMSTPDRKYASQFIDETRELFKFYYDVYIPKKKPKVRRKSKRVASLNLT